MKVKRPAPVRGNDERKRGSRQPGRNAQRRALEAPPRKRGRSADQRPLRQPPQTGPFQRAVDGPARPKNASQAKARAKARKAKAPKVVRLPLRERIVLRLASVELNPRTLIARVPFVVLVIAALGLGLGLTLWLSTGAAERSYQLGSHRNTNQALLQQKEALERDVLEAQAAPALAEAARNLGMIPSRDTAHLVQDPTGNWIVVGTPKPAEGVPPPPLNRPLPDDTPPPPAPPAPRVVDPRELAVRMPSPQAAGPLAATGPQAAHAPLGQVAAPGPLDAPPVAGDPAAPLTAPVDPAAALPAPAPAPVPPAAAPAEPAPPAALTEPAPLPPAVGDPAAPPAPAPLDAGPEHLPALQAPPLPGPTPGAEQFTPAVAPVPGAGA